MNKNSTIAVNENFYSQKIAKYNAFLAFFAALIFAIILTSLPIMGFTDRDSYINYANNSMTILQRYLPYGPVKILANEPVWLFTNVGLSQIFVDVNVIRTIIFTSSFVFAFIFLRTHPAFFVLLFFLLMPQILTNFTSHLRQGFALAIFMTALNLSGKKKYPVLLLTPFIHSSFVFVVLFYLWRPITKLVHLDLSVRKVSFIIFSVCLCLMLGNLASMVGDRRADSTYFDVTNISGFGFLFWLLILMLFYFQGKDWLERHEFAVYGLTFYVSSYFLFGATGRVLENTLPFILISALYLTKWRRNVFLVCMGTYVFMQWGRVVIPFAREIF